ncbi:hypothetical protein pqer_cds_132 [Pandoravirus quercus]|uniref:Uncharacterized protein n=1 Tax=Pandoravirus quercus TaxID=2107709 RepID=A0A2U7U804_9VIRU|nr:hypothetical protein pqer_cds_132 [Pandoravirus quercus]AVK74554.1 hypothetical protein pqer_cds_132 [Pandoravirus quercus]
MDDRPAPTSPAADCNHAPREACGIVLGGRFVCVHCTTSMLGRGFWPPTARFVAAPVGAVCSACGRCAVPSPDDNHTGAPPHDRSAETSTFRAISDNNTTIGDDESSRVPPPAPARGYTCTFM